MKMTKDELIKQMGEALEHIYSRVNEINIIDPSIIMDDDLPLVMSAIDAYRKAKAEATSIDAQRTQHDI